MVPPLPPPLLVDPELPLDSIVPSTITSSAWILSTPPPAQKKETAYYKPTINWASSLEDLSPGFPTKRVSNQSLQLQRLARKLKFHLKQVYIRYFSKS